MSGRLRRAGCRCFLVASAVLALAAGGCGRRAQPRDSRPNVLFILVDAMRADRLGCYGYERPTSPNLDALAAEGVIFTDATAPAAWTQVSIPSLMTGRRPHEHGIGWTQEGSQVYVQHGVRLPVLAEVLHDHGYRTAAFCANQIVGKEIGTDRGFEEFDHPVGRLPVWRRGSAEDVNRCTLDWLRRYDRRSGPFFLYLHYIDTHNLYRPPEPFAVFGRPGYTADDERVNIELNLVSEAGAPHVVTDADLAARGLSRRDVARMSDLYDGEVLCADHAIGELLQWLKNAGLYENTIVVVTADHGEAFLEHRDLEHGLVLYQELVHVPLIMRLPGVRGGQEVRQAIGIIGIAPTILGAVGLGDAVAMSGRNLYRELVDGTAIAPRPVISELPAERTYALRDGSLKLISGPDRVELYDLSRDPGERTDLAASRPAEVARLRVLLQRELARHPAAKTNAAPATEEELDALRALGYIH